MEDSLEQDEQVKNNNNIKINKKEEIKVKKRGFC